MTAGVLSLPVDLHRLFSGFCLSDGPSALKYSSAPTTWLFRERARLLLHSSFQSKIPCYSNGELPLLFWRRSPVNSRSFRQLLDLSVSAHDFVRQWDSRARLCHDVSVEVSRLRWTFLHNCRSCEWFSSFLTSSCPCDVTTHTVNGSSLTLKVNKLG